MSVVSQGMILEFQVEHKCDASCWYFCVVLHLFIDWLSDIHVHDFVGEFGCKIVVFWFALGQNVPIVVCNYVSCFTVLQGFEVERAMQEHIRIVNNDPFPISSDLFGCCDWFGVLRRLNNVVVDRYRLVRVRFVVFKPIATMSGVVLLVSVMFYIEFCKESSVLKARWMLLDWFEKVNTD
jgi:hypothetical protein